MIKLFCGNYKSVILGQNFDLIFTSPPYNIGSQSPKKITNRKFGGYDSKSWGAIEDYPDSINEDEYQQQQQDFLLWCAAHIKDSGNIIYNHKLRRKNGILIDPISWFPNTLYEHDRIIWDRKSTHNHCTKFTYDHYEYLYCLRKIGSENHYFKNQPFLWQENNSKGVGNVWGLSKEYGNNHNAPFPLLLARQVIRMWCPSNGLVCDPYSGSGTTMIGCYLENRDFIGAEILQKYYKYSLERLSCIKKTNSTEMVSV